MTKGVRQDCIASPYLFVTYTEKAMRDADVDTYGIKVGGIPISNLCYADDTALLESSVEDIEKLATAMYVTGKDMNLKLNVKKTKLLVAEPGRRHGRGRRKRVYNIRTYGEEVEQVDHFKYLGSMKTLNIKMQIARLTPKPGLEWPKEE
ncbi:uncharacterized protein [Amphiura filiformis]|uniref:uncharacterized protein n=1 Tax=Amphiura filiformis TaxID=82378 RepID=UPI003B2126CB